MTPTRSQVETAGLVLGTIATADLWAAKPDKAMAYTWAECFAVHDLQRGDLFNAVVELFADTTRKRTDRILPADIIAHARRLRQARMEREKATGEVDRATLSAARQAIADCALCDPNGYIDAGDADTRCSHGRQLGGVE